MSKKEFGSGYFGEWVRRFETINPKLSMDNLSRLVWDEMKEEGF